MLGRRDLLAALAAGPVVAGSSASAAGTSPAGQEAAGRALADALTDIHGAGARSDGVTDDAEAVGRAAAGGAILFSRGVTRIAHDLVISTYAQAEAGAIISPGSGVTVTFAGGFWAPLTAVFGGAGTIRFAPGAQAVAYPEWWGARAGDPAVDCAPAINACLDASPVTQLQQGAYHVRSPILMARHGQTLRGINDSQSPDHPCTQIVLEHAGPGLLCGRRSATAVGTVDEITLEAFTVRRQTPGGDTATDPALASIGVSLRWCALMHVRRVTVCDSAVSFYVFGCVECYFEQCSAMHLGGAGSAAAAWGFFLDYSAPLGLAGGNASLYFDRCRAFMGGRRTYGYSAGLASRGGFVDLVVSKFETGSHAFGIDLRGDGADAESYATQDCHIVDCLLDGNAVAGVRIQSAGRNCDVHISGCYIALGEGTPASACVLLGGEHPADAVAGAVTLSNCEFVGDFGGVIATNVAVCNLALNTHLNLQAPIAFVAVQCSEIRDTVRILRTPSPAHPAVRLERCEGVVVDLSASGADGGYRSGVSIDAASARIEVNCTRLSRAVVGGPTRLIEVDGHPWGGSASFGAHHIATGVLT